MSFSLNVKKTNEIIAKFKYWREEIYHEIDSLLFAILITFTKILEEQYAKDIWELDKREVQ